jgi:hypothetical protein
MSARCDEDDYAGRHADKLFRQMQAEEEKARNGEVFPFALLLFVFLGIAIGLLTIYRPTPDGPTAREIHDRAKLECRLSGGTYEYFGTQGYHCIGGRK